jgi:hypothetical protein
MEHEERVLRAITGGEPFNETPLIDLEPFYRHQRSRRTR